MARTNRDNGNPEIKSFEYYWYKPGIHGLIARAALRTLQFVFAILVAALYGIDLAHATKTHAHAHAEWIYSEVVACLSCITCLVHAFVTVTRVGWSVWDGILVILWSAQVGVFGTIYFHHVDARYEAATQSVNRMRVAAWISLVNMLLWVVTTVLGMAWCIRARRFTRRMEDVAEDSGEKEVKDSDSISGHTLVESVCTDEDNVFKKGYNEKKLEDRDGSEEDNGYASCASSMELGLTSKKNRYSDEK